MIWFIALLFWIITIGHFGWNLLPNSDAELICDGIFLVLVSLAYISNRKSKEPQQ